MDSSELEPARKMNIFVLIFLVGLQSFTWAYFVEGPLFQDATSFTFDISTSTLIKPTPCYITSDSVSQCRRKRGVEEKPRIIHFDDDLDVAPSAVIGVETTLAPRLITKRYNSKTVHSSFDNSYSASVNIFRQLAAKRRNNKITVGDCGLSTVNFSQFLSCLGMTVQETTTLTATFTQTETLSSGYTTMTVLGCTPAGFLYTYCPAAASVIETLGSRTHYLPPLKTIDESAAAQPSLRASGSTGSVNEEKRVESRIYKIKLIC
ncbi:uncharacterized protein LOC116932608 [Daphnia magna]|uniref:uncharacterized protein LOC116932608 n=1 Tax=Daphnia magna TaxID=35525 RepID=UPI001E1BC76E|nr:uncharacterized protein LOC116932608 [Daphnia magna]